MYKIKSHCLIIIIACVAVVLSACSSAALTPSPVPTDTAAPPTLAPTATVPSIPSPSATNAPSETPTITKDAYIAITDALNKNKQATSYRAEINMTEQGSVRQGIYLYWLGGRSERKRLALSK